MLREEKVLGVELFLVLVCRLIISLGTFASSPQNIGIHNTLRVSTFNRVTGTGRWLCWC